MKEKTSIAEKPLTPSVYWAQTKDQITLKIDLKDVKEQPKIAVKDQKLFQFQACGIGARGINKYQFGLNLYSDVNNAVDFDRWAAEEDNEEEDEQDKMTTRDIMQDYPGMYEKLQKEEYGFIREQGKKVYLVFYNLAQFIGYLYILVVMSILYYRDGNEALATTYDSVGNAMKFCQLLQYLEVMHPLFGYTKGSVFVAFLQVSGRNFVLFAMIESESRMQTKPVIFYLFFIWSLIEVVRYPYYITTLLGCNVSILTWLRYTMWIPLYPMGILCEGIVLLRNIPYFEETKRFSIFLPNKWNATFSMPAFIKLYLLLLILPGTYLVMTHMAKMRSKKLSSIGKSKLHRVD